MPLRSLILAAGLLTFVTSCNQGGVPITPRRPTKEMMAAPTSAFAGSQVSARKHVSMAQQRHYLDEAAKYRRAANQATGPEREQLLQKAEQMDAQAAAVAPQ